MSNVLPTETIKHEQLRMRARFIRVFGYIMLCSAAIASIALAPSYVSVRMAIMDLERSVATPPESQVVKADQAVVTRTQAIVNALKPVASATTSPTTALAAALEVKPAGISVTAISYGKGTLTLTGTGKNRDVINAYRDALDANPLFTSVVIPVAALVGAQEGKLTITLRGAF